MKLLLFINNMHEDITGGGLTRWLFINYLHENGHDIEVIALKYGDQPTRETRNGINIRRPFPASSDVRFIPNFLGSFWNYLSTIYFVFYAVVAMNISDFDIIKSNSHIYIPTAKLANILSNSSSLTVNFIGYTPSLHENRNTELLNLFRNNECEPSFLISIFEYLNIRVFSGDIVFVRNKGIKKKFARIKTSEDIYTINGVVDSEQIRKVSNRKIERPDFSKDNYLFVFVGHRRVKQPDKAIEVVENLNRGHKLLIIGHDKKYPESKNIRSISKVSHAQLLEYMAVADGLLLTSIVEAYPTVVFEALSLDCQVFATPVGDLAQLNIGGLFTSEVDNLPQVINQNSKNKSGRINEDVLQKHSAKEYTREFLMHIPAELLNEADKDLIQND